jgi:hypothetical protein
MESRRAALVVAAFVLLSGCVGSALGPSTTPTTETRTTVSPTTTTTAPQSEEPTESASSPTENEPTSTTTTAESLPPGVNRTGLENASALVDAHQRALDDASFAFYFRANVSVGPARQWTFQRGRVEANLSPLVVRSKSVRRIDDDRTSVGTDLWANETTVVAQYQRENRTELRRYNRTGGNLGDETWDHLPRADLDSQVTQAWILELALTAGEYDLVRTERRDGRQFAVLRATEAVTATNFTDLNATVVVDSDGRAHSVSLTAAYAGDDENRIHYEFGLSDVGSVEVERPQWVGAATPPNESANATTISAEETTPVEANATTTPE